MARPPCTFSRLIANAAAVATNSVMAPTATAISTEFHSWIQKWCR